MQRSSRAFSSSAGVSNRSGTWRWAAGSLLAVALVLGTALAGHAVVAGRRAPPQQVAAPTLPPLAIVATTPVSLSVQLAALDTSAGTLVALTTAGEPTCPPTAACSAAPPLQRFVVFDGQTGAPLAFTALAGGATGSVLLLADSSRHLAYAVAPRSVDVFSTLTGQRVGGYALNDMPWVREGGGVFDAAANALILEGGGVVEALDAATGQALAAWQAPGNTAQVDGPLLDGTHGLIYVLAEPAVGQPTLFSLDAATLAQHGEATLPAGSRLGPLNATSLRLYVFTTRGSPCQYTVNSASRLSLTEVGSDTASCNASAVGWNSDLGDIYIADATGISLRRSGATSSVAALPLRVAWPATVPLLVDATRGLVYLPDSYGTVLIARDGGTAEAATTLTPASAVVLARAALGTFLPDTGQDPPFIAAERFPAAAGTVTLDFWQHFGDIGWRGPFAGTTTTAVKPTAGSPAGSYTVTFAMAWNDVLARRHTWVCRVAPDGSVLLQSESGDPVP